LTDDVNNAGDINGIISDDYVRDDVVGKMRKPAFVSNVRKKKERKRKKKKKKEKKKEDKRKRGEGGRGILCEISGISIA